MTHLSLLQPGDPLALAATHGCSAHITYLESGVVGLIQGVTELFPVSSLGHNVLLPGLLGGCWAQNLNVAATESPYLAFIVGLHVATAIALLIYFWRDWVRIIGGFFTSLRHIVAPPPGEGRFDFQSVDERMAWMIILATIPVGLVGLLFEHEFRTIFGKPVYAAVFLVVNGLIMFAGERFRRRRSIEADHEVAEEREYAMANAGRVGRGRHSARQESARDVEAAEGVAADRRLSAIGYGEAIIIGSSQILALLAGISRDGIALVGGMFRGLSRQDAARFAFLLATPVILAAGALKIPDLLGPLGNGIHGQVIFGSVLSGVGAYVSVRFLTQYFSKARTLTPFAIYCFVAGLGSIIYLVAFKHTAL